MTDKAPSDRTIREMGQQLASSFFRQLDDAAMGTEPAGTATLSADGPSLTIESLEATIRELETLLTPVYYATSEQCELDTVIKAGLRHTPKTCFVFHPDLYDRMDRWARQHGCKLVHIRDAPPITEEERAEIKQELIAEIEKILGV